MGAPDRRRAPWEQPAPPPAVPAAEVVVAAERPGAAGGREVDLVVRANGAYEVTLSAADERPVRWRPAGIAGSAVAETPRLVLVAAPEDGWRITVALPDRRPLPLVVSARHAIATPEADALVRRLPEWTTAYAEAVVRREERF